LAAQAAQASSIPLQEHLFITLVVVEAPVVQILQDHIMVVMAALAAVVVEDFITIHLALMLLALGAQMVEMQATHLLATVEQGERTLAAVAAVREFTEMALDQAVLV
jgi:hypothetical protein